MQIIHITHAKFNHTHIIHNNIIIVCERMYKIINSSSNLLWTYKLHAYTKTYVL